MKNFLLFLVGLLLVIVLSFGTIRPLFSPGFFPMHDDTQPARIDQMAKSLISGQFPVRIVGELGYGFGYPLFNFYAPLPYYIGAFFNITGFDALAAAKIMFMIGIVLAGLSMFFLVKEIAGSQAALTSSILYMYAPYHAVDIYVRGAAGEFYALGFLPLILLGIIKITKPFYSSSPSTFARDKLESRSLSRAKSRDLSSRQARTIRELKRGIIIGSIGIAGILLSHNILGMISGYFLGFILISYFVLLVMPNLFRHPFRVNLQDEPIGILKQVQDDRKSVKDSTNLFTFYFLLFTFFLGIGLSAFFTLPAVVEKK
ncbi:hypothetical protein HY945_01840, partial [Candidatus Gottesmanbacteria bacterium]|nr:hypothetical protein [Candidatus Gottesmanbacteria bacterium]